jgi:hypothetical protein
LRAQWFALDWLLLEAQGEVGVPFVIARYRIEPNVVLAQISPVFGAFGAGAGVRFP